jgi:cytochrome c
MSHSSPSAGARRLVAFSLLACASVATSANTALARKQGCLGCHAVASKLVGPSYQDVAAKYAGQADAVTQLVQSIRNGGSGKWGEMAMPPQAQLSEADARRLATWILGGAK